MRPHLCVRGNASLRRRSDGLIPGRRFNANSIKLCLRRSISLTITHCPLAIDWQAEKFGKIALQDNVQCGIGNGQCPHYLSAIGVETPAWDQTVAVTTKKSFAQRAKIWVMTRRYSATCVRGLDEFRRHPPGGR